MTATAWILGGSGCAGCEDANEQFREAVATEMDKFASGDLSAAVRLWEVRETVQNTQQLKNKYPRKTLWKMLNAAAEAGDANALFHRFWETIHDRSRKEIELAISDLKLAFDGGVDEAGPILALTVALSEDNASHAAEIIKTFFENRSELVDTFSEKISIEDVSKFEKILAGEIDLAGKSAGATMFESSELNSAWNTWYVFIRPRIPQSR